MSKKAKIALIIIILIAVGAFLFIKNRNKGQVEYTLEKVNNYNYFILKQDNKYGVMGANGDTIITPVYDEVRIPNPEKDVFICYKDNATTCLNSNNEPIFANYNQVEPIRLKNTVSDLMYEKSTLTYVKDDKMGLINLDGKKIVDSKYESIETLPSQEGKLLVKQQGKVGIININGHEIIKPEYDQIKEDGYYENDSDIQKSGYITSNTTKEGYRYGYINYKGEELLKPEYNDISRILDIKDSENAYLILAKDGKYGVYKNGNAVVKNDYQSISYEQGNQVFVVEKSGIYGIADLKGSMVVPLEYNQIDITGIGIYAKKGEQTTIFDKNGKTLELEENTSVLNTGNENYKIKISSSDGAISYGVINNKGEEAIPQNYSYIEYLSENYFIASNKDGKLGVLDTNNKEVLPLEYASIHKIDGTSIVQTGRDTDQINEFYTSKLEKICESPASTVTLNGNYVYIQSDEGIKYIDKETEQEVKNTDVFKENMLFSAKDENGNWGFVDKAGNVKIDYQYEKVTELNKYGYAGVKKDGKWGVINSEGEIILEPTYTISEENEKDLNFIGKYYSVEYGFGEIYYTSDNA